MAAPSITDFPNPLVPERFDSVTDMSYDVAGNLLTVSFRRGGVAGVVLATLTLAYDTAGNLTSVARS